MGLFTTIFIYPTERPRYTPDDDLVHSLFRYLGADKAEEVDGEPPEPWWRRFYRPMMEVIGESVFFERDVAIERVLELSRRRDAESVGMSLPHTGWSKELSDYLRAHVSEELSDGYIAWDTQLTFRSWEARDHDTDRLMAKGRFAITRSGDGCPTDLEEYLSVFNGAPGVIDLGDFLQSSTGLKWGTLIELS